MAERLRGLPGASEKKSRPPWPADSWLPMHCAMLPADMPMGEDMP
jgi:hypothetical protein